MKKHPLKEKITTSNILERIEEREILSKKANYTFRLNVETMKKFKKKCEEWDVSMASFLEECIVASIQD